MPFTGELPSLELLTMCFDQLKMRGGLHLGELFYQSPSVTEVKKLQASVEKDGYHKLLEEEDPRLLIALALNILKQAPQPVIPFDLYDYVLEVSNQPESSLGYANGDGGSSTMESSEGKEEVDDRSAEGKMVKLSELKKLVRRLPIQNWTILLRVLEFVTEVVDLSTINNTSLDSVVRVFSPILCRPRDSAYMSLRHLHDLHNIQTVVHSLVLKHKVLMHATRDPISMGGEEYPCPSMSSNNSSFASDIQSTHDHINCGSVSECGSSMLGEKSASDMSFTADDVATVNNIIDESVAIIFDDMSVFEPFSDNFEAIKSSSNQKLPIVQQVPQIICSPMLSIAMMRVMWRSRALNEGSGSGHSKALHDEEDGDQNNAELGRDSNPAGSSFMFSGTLGGPRDRKRMIAACRTLRSQITQYEDAFLQDSGHLPRGHERYPFASTYAQYKQWKREVRYDASTSVQALVRGFIARCKYPLNQGESPHRNVAELKDKEKNPCYVTELQKLLVKKNQVKNQLKEYDQKFLANNGRNPTKADKEPMRDTYTLYSNLKYRINELGLLVRSERDKNVYLGSSTNGSQNECEMKQQNQESQIKLYEKLKNDKKKLQTLLEEYEKNFKRIHGRAVNSRSDIAPVEAEYLHYRELKQKFARKSK